MKKFFNFNLWMLTGILIILSSVMMICDVAFNGAISSQTMTPLGIIGLAIFILALVLVPFALLTSWINSIRK